jgi:hypothetical protein
MLPAALMFDHGGRVEIAFMVDLSEGSVDRSTMDHAAMGYDATDG